MNSQRLFNQDLPFDITLFDAVYKHPVIQDSLFGDDSKLVDESINKKSAVKDIAKVAAVHFHKASLAWELIKHHQRLMTADEKEYLDKHHVVHVVSDRKLNQYLDSILSDEASNLEKILFGNKPFISASVVGEGLTYFRVSPSTLQAKLVLSFDPNKIIFTAGNDIGSATVKYCTDQSVEDFYKILNEHEQVAKIIGSLIRCVKNKSDERLHAEKLEKLLSLYFADEKVYALDPNKNKHPLGFHHGYNPQSLMSLTPIMAKLSSQKRIYNEILVERDEKIRVMKILIEKSDWQAANNAAKMGNIDAQMAIKKLHILREKSPLSVEIIADTELRVINHVEQDDIERLNVAISSYDINVIESLLGPISIANTCGSLTNDQIDFAGQSLQIACYFANMAVVTKLLNSNPSLVNHANGMPLLTAMIRRDKKLISLLMSYGADISLCMRELKQILTVNIRENESHEYLRLLGLKDLNIVNNKKSIEILPKSMNGHSVLRMDPNELPEWVDLTSEPSDDVWRQLAINYINLPYEDEWEKRFAVNDNIVYRPNHDVTHAIRQKWYLEYIVQALNNSGKSEYQGLISGEFYSLLKLAVFIGRAGRTNEYRAHADSLNFERSANLLELIANRYGFDEKLTTIVVNSILNKPDITKLGKLAHIVLHESHALDMVRMLTKPDFDNKIIPSSTKAFSELFDEEYLPKLMNNLIMLAIESCKQTGNKCIYANIKEDNLKKSECTSHFCEPSQIGVRLIR